MPASRAPTRSACSAAGHGFDLRLRGGERGGAGTRTVFAAQLDAAHAGGAQRAARPSGAGACPSSVPATEKVLAYLREYGDETILCVANLGRTAQPVELDLAAYRGRVPVEMMGRTAFPPIGERFYLLTLPACGFYWFRLATDVEVPHWHEERVAPEERPVLVLFDGWTSFSETASCPGACAWRRSCARSSRPTHCRATSPRSAGMRPRGQPIKRATLDDWAPWGPAARSWLITLLQVETAAGQSVYFLPMALAYGDGDDETCAHSPPRRWRGCASSRRSACSRMHSPTKPSAARWWRPSVPEA